MPDPPPPGFMLWPYTGAVQSWMFPEEVPGFLIRLQVGAVGGRGAVDPSLVRVQLGYPSWASYYNVIWPDIDGEGLIPTSSYVLRAPPYGQEMAVAVGGDGAGAAGGFNGGGNGGAGAYGGGGATTVVQVGNPASGLLVCIPGTGGGTGSPPGPWVPDPPFDNGGPQNSFICGSLDTEGGNLGEWSFQPAPTGGNPFPGIDGIGGYGGGIANLDPLTLGGPEDGESWATRSTLTVARGGQGVTGNATGCLYGNVSGGGGGGGFGGGGGGWGTFRTDTYNACPGEQEEGGKNWWSPGQAGGHMLSLNRPDAGVGYCSFGAYTEDPFLVISWYWEAISRAGGWKIGAIGVGAVQ